VARLALITAVGVSVEANRSQRARDLGDKADLRRATARGRELLERARASVIDGGPVEAAWSVMAEAEAAVARGKPDPARWGKAAKAWDALKRPYLAARARFHQAEAYVVRDDRVRAAESARTALECADRLGAGWLAAEIRALATRGRLRLETEAEPVPEPAAEDPFGLTPRERQVLERVARGATNREIGQDLFMAEKTASVHVSRILAKLDVRTRTEAAAVAHRLGLAEERIKQD
jgi:DNA-binding CsgD family transcriptional regulator